MGTLKKQTAVEWLAQWLHDNPVVYQKDYYAAIGRAKAMEKEQMTTFAKMWESKIFDGSIDSVDDYYNQTYGGDK